MASVFAADGIPYCYPYNKASDYLSYWELVESATISRARAYVEHLVGKVKRFAFLDSYPVKPGMHVVLDDIVYVCTYLTHFQGPLVFEKPGEETETEATE